jgi:amino acid transporter
MSNLLSPFFLNKGVASVSNALSQYVDFLCGRKIRKFMLTYMPINSPGMGLYPDFLALLFASVVTFLMIIGVKESARANKIFVLLNIAILSFIIILGATKIDFNNWNLKISSNSSWNDSTGSNMSCSYEKCGVGGFMPFGFTGVLNGASKCFFAYVGFDAIASTGEEVINPKRNIPLGILITLVLVSVLYCGLAAVISLMLPYYMVDADTPLPYAFKYVNMTWATVLVSIAAIISLITW